MRASHKAVFDALVEAQQQRQARIDWREYEMQVVLHKVNEFRAAKDRPPIDLLALERVEAMALGHVDYTRKFALYASELADGVEVTR